MVEVWVLYAVAAAVLFAIINVADKIVISKEMKDPVLATTISGLVAFLLLSGVGLIKGNIFIPWPYALAVIASGIISVCAVYYYYLAVKKGDVSRVITLIGFMPIFVLIMAFIFLGERLTLIRYAGIGIIVLGAVLISFNKVVLSRKAKILATVFALISAFLFSLREIINKSFLFSYDIWTLLFWFGIGAGIFSAGLLLKHHPKLKNKGRKGVFHFVIIDIVGNLARMLLFISYSVGSVSLATALVQIKPLLVLVMALIIGKWHPKILKEQLSRKTIVRRLIAMILIIVGSILII